MGAAWGSSPAPLERAGTVPSRAGPIVGFSLRRWNGREPWPTRPGPHFLGRNGGKNPRGKRFFPLDSLLWWGCVGGGCTSYGIPGLRPSQRKARNGPPTGWAGWGRGWVPFGRRQRGTVWFPAFSSRQQTTSPARPSRWAGHEALVLEAAGQAHTDPTTFPRSSTREWGSKGKEPPSPWCSFPYFFQEIGPRLGNHRSPPFQRRRGRTPHRPPPRACPPTAQFAIFEKGSHLCQRKICPFLRCFFNTAPPPPWPLS